MAFGLKYRFEIVNKLEDSLAPFVNDVASSSNRSLGIPYLPHLHNPAIRGKWMKSVHPGKYVSATLHTLGVMTSTCLCF